MGLKLRDILAQATRLVEAGELVPLIDPRRFSLASVESAYNALRDGDAQGKIIVDLPGTARGETFIDALEGISPLATQPRTWPPSGASSPGKSTPRSLSTL
jgi:Zinc-binding dehydrogenase